MSGVFARCLHLGWWYNDDFTTTYRLSTLQVIESRCRVLGLELLVDIWDVTRFKPGVKASCVFSAIEHCTPQMIQGLQKYDSYWLPENATWEQYSLHDAIRRLCVYLLYRVYKDDARDDFVFKRDENSQSYFSTLEVVIWNFTNDIIKGNFLKVSAGLFNAWNQKQYAGAG